MAKNIKIPEVIRWFGPFLDALRQLGGSAKPKEVVDKIAKNLNLPDSILEETTKTGTLRFANQVAWVRLYLVKEGYLEDNTRGIWSLTPIGKTTYIDKDQAYKIFLKWVKLNAKNKNESFNNSLKQSSENIKNNDIVEVLEENSPDDFIKTISLLETLQSLSASGFEQVCKRLLLEHDFENVVVTGSSHDGGIDGYGILELNPFVSIKVLFQCKRYKGTVSRAQVGDFRNAMIGRAEKGIILTTGTFSEDAKREASRDGAPPIELIDGQKLISLFKDVRLGIKPKEVWEVDLDFFSQYMDKSQVKL